MKYAIVQSSQLTHAGGWSNWQPSYHIRSVAVDVTERKIEAVQKQLDRMQKHLDSLVDLRESIQTLPEGERLTCDQHDQLYFELRSRT